MAGDIQVLRDLRDGHLITNGSGRAFVDFHYRGSPPIAGFISENPVLKPVVRAGLSPAVVMGTVVVNTTPAARTAIVGLLVLVSAPLAVRATKRRRTDPGYARR